MPPSQPRQNGLPLTTDGSARACDTVGVDRRARLRDARLYFVADRGGMERALEGALAGGVDLFQLRDKDASDDELLAAAATARALCDAAGALFLLNDRPDLAAACGADGVHVGQDDMPVDRARKLVGDDAIVGLSTHSLQQAQAGCRTGADYIAVGPVHATPTKEGRPGDRRRAGQVRRGPRLGPVVRDRRHRRRHRRRRGQGRRAAGRGRARDRPGRRPRGGGARAARRGERGAPWVGAAASSAPARGRRSRRRHRASPFRRIACAAATRAPRSATPRCARSSSRSRPTSVPRRS